MTPSMDRLAVLAVGVALAVGVVACGDSDSEDPPAQADTAERAEAPDRDEPATTTPGRATPDGAPDAGGAGRAAPNADDGSSGNSAGSADDTTSGGSTPGVKGGGSATAEIAGVITNMYNAFAAGDPAGVCATMSKAGKRRMAAGVGSCKAALAGLADAAAAGAKNQSAPNVTAKDIVIRGRHATVTVSPDGDDGTVSLVRENGRWLLDGNLR